MENPGTKNLIKKGIKITSRIKLLSENDFKIADQASDWIDLAIGQLNRVGEDQDVINLLEVENVFYGILFPSLYMSEQKNKESFKNKLEIFINKLIQHLIRLKNNKEISPVIYLKKDKIYTITNGEKVYIFRKNCKREGLLKEILKKKNISGSELLSIFKYKSFSLLSKEIAGINTKNKLLGIEDKIVQNNTGGYYINPTIKIFDQS